MVLLLFLGRFRSWTVHRRHADRLPSPIETVCFAHCLERVFWLVYVPSLLFVGLPL